MIDHSCVTEKVSHPVVLSHLMAFFLCRYLLYGFVAIYVIAFVCPLIYQWQSFETRDLPMVKKEISFSLRAVNRFASNLLYASEGTRRK